MATAEEFKRGLIGKGRSQRVTPSLNLYVHFSTDKDTLTSEGQAQVAELATALKDAAFANDRFALVGHTDKTGSDQHNQDLSERRARRAEIDRAAGEAAFQWVIHRLCWFFPTKDTHTTLSPPARCKFPTLLS